MALSRGELLAAARGEREGLGRTIQYAPPESWEAPSACPGWWNRDVVAHLAAQDTAAAQLLADEEPVELEAYRRSLGDAPFSVDGLNDFAVANRAGRPYREVLREWGRAADALLALAARLPEQDWEQRRVPWIAGTIRVPYLIQSRVVEWWVHGEDIRAGAGMGPRIEHPPIFLTNDLAIRMLPWALSLAGLAFPGRSVLVELEGAGGGRWHWGLGVREVPAEDEKPDAFIVGRAHPFALVAARRASADRFLDDGQLAVGGDEDLALTILEHIRVSP
ncbi:MAG TPA: maleylpyruvate isomerase family mycothiol-dependent enzyme [Actinomycetota bacterium]|nr:maleylpyruvate isomerase family mycothiol-dependent enzyme [Actinomycetota bacterium]